MSKPASALRWDDPVRHAYGKAMAHMAVVFAELERDFIRSRPREALAVRRDHGAVLAWSRGPVPRISC